MKKIALSLLALAALSSASMAGSFNDRYFDQSGFAAPGDDHQGAHGGGDTGR